jgi:4-aminobutyrate aminotransferase-like enzyme
MIAVEIVRRVVTDAEMTNKVAKACHTNGVLVLTAAETFFPPMVMSEIC